MPLKTLSRKKVSRLCLGTWSLGKNSKNFSSYGPIDEKRENILNYAYKNKINFFDTANVYGDAEKLLGKVFKKQRKDLFIATKVGCISFNEELNFSKKFISKQIKKTLENLETDYLDLVQLYGPPTKIKEIKECIGFLKKLKKKKIVRNIGISLRNPNDYVYFRKFFKVDFIQCNLNILDQRILDKKIWKYIKRDNVIFMPRTVLNFGFFTENFFR
jgi:Predicted oxidoreductases (related to aryl-alcohol dehydrogenases)